MDATEIRRLTEDAVAELLAGRQVRAADSSADARRKTPRWPFPGQVQLWITDDDGVEQLSFATCVDLSLHGLGMLYEDALPPGLELALAIHQPEASLHGHGVVRHCTEREAGYYIGVEFLFGKE